MSVNRRFVLKGMALSSLTGLALTGALPVSGALLPAAPVQFSQSSALPIVVLSGKHMADNFFLQGVSAALGAPAQEQYLGPDLSALLGFERQLRQAESLRVIGLLDNATATLALDMARSAGARIHWIGHHSSTAQAGQHRLLSSESSHECCRQFGRQLTADGVPPGVAVTHHLTSPGSPDATIWLTELGYLLASVGREPAGTLPHSTATDTALLTGSFVSFLIET